MNEELKPCPFCGVRPRYGRYDKKKVVLNCTCFGSVGPTTYVDKWNTRPTEDALRSELAAAREDADRLYTAIEAAEGILFGPRFIPDPNTDDNLRLRAVERAKLEHDKLKVKGASRDRH